MTIRSRTYQKVKSTGFPFICVQPNRLSKGASLEMKSQKTCPHRPLWMKAISPSCVRVPVRVSPYMDSSISGMQSKFHAT